MRQILPGYPLGPGLPTNPRVPSLPLRPLKPKTFKSNEKHYYSLTVLSYVLYSQSNANYHLINGNYNVIFFNSNKIIYRHILKTSIVFHTYASTRSSEANITLFSR